MNRDDWLVVGVLALIEVLSAALYVYCSREWENAAVYLDD